MLGLITDVFSQAVAVLVLGHSKPSRFKLSRNSLNVQLREVMMRLLINYKLFLTLMENRQQLYFIKVVTVPITARIRRSQVKEFDFKKQCLFCAEPCGDRVVQCERKGIKGAPAFKQVVLQCCDDRIDAWRREISMRCHGVHDLAAAEAQYHFRCYDNFRKIPSSDSEQGLAVD